MLETYDANGNKVTGSTGTCVRCGAHIKYIYEFEGQTYGSTCIEAVSGIRPDNWVWKDGKPNYQATEEANDKIEAERLEFIYNNTVLHQERLAVKEQNKIDFFELINILENASRYNGDFCYNMAEQIKNDGSTNDLYEILGHNPYNIVREIWGKQTGGRKNSKAYKAAVAEFDQKYEL